MYYDIGNSSIFPFTHSSLPVPYSTASDGYFGIYYMDNELIHSDYCIGYYLGNYNGADYTDIKTNFNKVHVFESHYYFAGKSTNPNYMRREGDGPDVSGALGAYSNAQSWPFNGNQAINTAGGSVYYNPDATMMRINMASMPMVAIGVKEQMKNSPSLLIFPNPSTNMLNIYSKLDGVDNVTIEIVNLLGQTVYNESLGSKTEISAGINISNLSNGVYNVTVKGNKFQVNKLFIKQ